MYKKECLFIIINSLLIIVGAICILTIPTFYLVEKMTIIHEIIPNCKIILIFVGLSFIFLSTLALLSWRYKNDYMLRLFIFLYGILIGIESFCLLIFLATPDYVNNFVNKDKFESDIKNIEFFKRAQKAYECCGLEGSHDYIKNPLYSLVFQMNQSHLVQMQLLLQSSELSSILKNKKLLEVLNSNHTIKLLKKLKIKEFLNSKMFIEVVNSAGFTELMKSKIVSNLVDTEIIEKLFQSGLLDKLIEADKIIWFIESGNLLKLLESKQFLQIVQSPKFSKFVESQQFRNIIQGNLLNDLLKSDVLFSILNEYVFDGTFDATSALNNNNTDNRYPRSYNLNLTHHQNSNLTHHQNSNSKHKFSTSYNIFDQFNTMINEYSKKTNKYNRRSLDDIFEVLPEFCCATSPCHSSKSFNGCKPKYENSLNSLKIFGYSFGCSIGLLQIILILITMIMESGTTYHINRLTYQSITSKL